MTSIDTQLAQFLVECPAHRSALDSGDNEFGVPLNTSGLYAFWVWQDDTGRKARSVANVLCETLVRAYGKACETGE